ncbi:MAG TPA: AMP-binding protein [Actinomycetota bacterium]|nr:AMP-binding protein [Actinomycetota bacterium]
MGVGEHNLARLSEQAFERHGDYESLFFEGKWYRSGELRDRSMRLAGGLIELGIEPGDRVVVMTSNTPDVGVAYTALWRAGAAITPAIFLLSPEDLRHILVSSEARAVIVSPEWLPTVRAASEGVETLKWTISLGDEEDGVIGFESLLTAEPASIVDRDDSDLAALMFTGGTTGRAKGVMISHENLYYAGKAGHEVSYIPGITKTIVPLPLSHSYGLLVTAASIHAVERGQGFLQRWFDGPNFLELVQEHQIQSGAVVPSMLQMMLTLPLENYDLSSLQHLVSGASPLAADVVAEFERRVPSVEIREGYGLTETTALVSTNPPGQRRLGSVGKPVPGSEVRIVDEDGNDLPRGEAGEIICRSPMIMLGYWRSDEATDESIKDGWFYSGDIGKIDEDGYIWILDRKKDLIIRGGFNVYPRDVEDVLLEHPAVAVAGVVGKPDTVKGEEVVAFVQLDPGQEAPTSDELVEFARGKLGKYKYPREVRIVDQVPLTPVFKIDRKQLRTML